MPLYHFANDPFETRNLWVEHSDVVARLADRLKTVQASERTAPQR